MQGRLPFLGAAVCRSVAMTMNTTVPCPICKKPVPLDDPNMPFCGERCRVIDLGNWASERYVISSPAKTNDFDDLEEVDNFERPEGFPR